MSDNPSCKSSSDDKSAATSAKHYLFIHALLDKKEEWGGCLAEFYPPIAQPALLRCLLQTTDWESVLGKRPLYLPVDPDTLETNDWPDNFYLVHHFFSGTLEDDPLYQRFLASGKKTAVFIDSKASFPYALNAQQVLLKTSHVRTIMPLLFKDFCKKNHVILIEVMVYADLEWAKERLIPLFSSDFILMDSGKNKKQDSNSLKLLKILSLLADDADTRELESVFRQEPKISYSLLRMVNSPAVSPRSPITSFSQAINIMGRKPLQRWLQLLVYSDPKNGQGRHPLLQRAAFRGRVLEFFLNAEDRAEGITPDTAFMIGAFSLLDILLHCPLTELLEHLPQDKILQTALARREGKFGKLLQVLVAIDNHDMPQAVRLLEELGCSAEDFLEAQIAACRWVVSMEG